MENHSTNVIPFKFEAFEIRTLVIGGEPWFVVKDIAGALEYAKTSAPAKLVEHVPEQWKGVNRIHTPGGIQRLLLLSEQGLYFFIGRSDKPKALPFQMWLAGDVLPAIRKHGRYEDTAGTMHTLMGEVIGTSGFRCLAAVMDGKVAHLPKALRAGARNHLWSQVHKAFSVVTAEDIPASEMDAARNFIGAYALEGQWLPRQEAANDFDYPAAWIWQNNPALTAGPQRVNGHNGLFLGLKVLAPSEFKSPIWDAIRKLKAQGANTEGLEIEWKARKELMYLLSRIIEDATYRLNEHMQHAPFFPVPDNRPLLD